LYSGGVVLGAVEAFAIEAAAFIKVAALVAINSITVLTLQILEAFAGTSTPCWVAVDSFLFSCLLTHRL
jgi:hypothetical protein